MAKKKPASKGCNCLEACQKELRAQNIRLQTVMRMDFTKGRGFVDGPLLAVEKIEPSKVKLPTFFCSYCPICGKKKPE